MNARPDAVLLDSWSGGWSRMGLSGWTKSEADLRKL